jgi:5-methylcytosine-specific restriction endonuclease McrA
MGVLLPDMSLWTLELAAEFHAIREAQQAARRYARYGPEALAWLAVNPIYRLEPWDVTKPAKVVDHIIPHKGDYELMWSPANHQPVTKRAHDRKTATEERSPAGVDNEKAQTRSP